MKLLGNSTEAAESAGELFRMYDEESLTLLADVWGDDQSYVDASIIMRQIYTGIKWFLFNGKALVYRLIRQLITTDSRAMKPIKRHPVFILTSLKYS